jgi:hypothetical protein
MGTAGTHLREVRESWDLGQVLWEEVAHFICEYRGLEESSSLLPVLGGPLAGIKRLFGEGPGGGCMISVTLVALSSFLCNMVILILSPFH